MKSLSSRSLQLAVCALLALSLGGCIVLPVGHRHHHHHDKGRHASERAVVVVPVERGHDHRRRY